MNGFVVGSDGVAHDYDDWADTEFGPQFQQQAWSDGEQPFEPQPYRERRRWVTTLAGAGIAMALGVLVAAVVLLTTGASDDHNSWPPGYVNPAPVTPTPEVVMPPVPFTEVPSVMAQAETQDGLFLQILRKAWDANRAATVIDPAQAIEFGHVACHNLRVTGETVHSEAIFQWVSNHDNLPLMAYEIEVDTAKTVYCPELG